MGSAEMWLLEEQLLPVGCQSPSATWSILLTVCSGPERAISQCSGDRGAASQELMRLWILGTQRTVELCVPVSRLKYLKESAWILPHWWALFVMYNIHFSIFVARLTGSSICTLLWDRWKVHFLSYERIIIRNVLNLSTPSLCYLLCNILTHGWCNAIELPDQ